MRSGAWGMIAACVAAGGFGRAQQLSETVWRSAADALDTRPGLLRHYVFADGAATQPNRAAVAAAMVYRPDGHSTVTAETGRVEGHRAVVLDGDSFEAPAVALSCNALTVSVWLRPIAMGVKTGNSGSVNGMIVSSGSGYNDGWRLVVYDWNARQPSFEIGREKGSFGVCAGDGLSAGFWTHVAATWDGAAVRVYVNGMLSAEKPYGGPADPAKSGLRIGYSGFGVGSLRMAVDELAIFGEALAPDEVAALALLGAPLSAAKRMAVCRAQEEAGHGTPAAAVAYLGLAGDETLPPAWRTWAKLAAVRLAKDRKDACSEACAALFDDASAPVNLRGQAAEYLVQICRRGEGAALPSRVLVRLPELLDLDADGQRVFGLALAASLAREGDVDGAGRIYERLLTAPDAAPAEIAEVRVRYAQALRLASRWGEARAQYEALAADARQPAHVRGIAAEAAGQTWRLEGKPAEAARAFRAAAAQTNQLPHIREEALACAGECENVAAGRPACDPESHRFRLLPLPTPGVTFVVAPDGDDANPGTREKPFATLERARDAVRACKVDGALPRGGATVYLRGGRYVVTNTFTLGEEDSGLFGAPVVYRAWRDERPVLDGGFRVRRLSKIGDPAVLARLPEAARGHVRVADLTAQGFADFGPQKSYGYGLNNKVVRELFEDGAPLRIARWPNQDVLKIGEVLDATNRVFACAEASARMSRWALASDLMANGYWLHLWAGCTVPVASTDPAAGTFRLGEKPGYGMAKERPFYVLNLLEEIDEPGEWFLDRAAGKLYVWPLRHPWFSDFVLSRWNRPFVEARKVREVVLLGLTFEYGQQHGIVMDECVNASVVGCVVRRMGGTALTVTQGANVKIYGNAFHTLGHTGMHVTGGNRKNLTSGQIVIENNEVSDFGRCSRTYNPAVLLEGCGARVAHNHFHHAPSSAMRIEGNDHLIEYNLVDHVVQESDDQGGIDMWGNPSYRGVVIRFNRWRDIGGGDIPCGQAAIRFDDAISGTLVYGNLFERTSNGHFGGVQIHGGQMNIVDNNVFVDCKIGVSFSPWGPKRWNDYLTRDSMKRLLYDDVDIKLPPYSKRYPELCELTKNVDVNDVWRNVFVGCGEMFFHAPKGVVAWGNEVAPVGVDPLAAASAPLFRPLPLDEIGRYDDPNVARE